jgi:hypothetical protein
MRRVAALGVLFALLLLAGPDEVAAQLRGVRFEIASVGDTTVIFRRGAESWVRRESRAIAVDPQRRDELVARLRVVSVDRGGLVTALVTGQTTVLSTDHVVVMDEPRRPWWRARSFWGGVLAGAAAGAVVAGQL